MTKEELLALMKQIVSATVQEELAKSKDAATPAPEIVQTKVMAEVAKQLDAIKLEKEGDAEPDEEMVKQFEEMKKAALADIGTQAADIVKEQLAAVEMAKTVSTLVEDGIAKNLGRLLEDKGPGMPNGFGTFLKGRSEPAQVFSISRFCKSQIENDASIAPFEREICKGEYDLTKVQSGALHTDGGFGVGTQRQSTIINILHNRATMRRIGVQIIPMTNAGTIEQMKLTTGLSGAWGAENVAALITTMKGGTVRWTPKKLTAAALFPKSLLLTGGPAMDSLIESELGITLALLEDLAYFTGDGVGSTPLGLLNMAGTIKSAGRTFATYKDTDPGDAITEIMANNADPDNRIMSPGLKNVINSLKDGNGRFIFDDSPNRNVLDGQSVSLMDGGRLNGLPVRLTNQLKSGTTHYDVVGDFKSAKIAQLQGLTIESTSEGKELMLAGQVLIMATMWVDFNVQHEEVFSIRTVTET